MTDHFGVSDKSFQVFKNRNLYENFPEIVSLTIDFEITVFDPNSLPPNLQTSDTTLAGELLIFKKSESMVRVVSFINFEWMLPVHVSICSELSSFVFFTPSPLS